MPGFCHLHRVCTDKATMKHQRTAGDTRYRLQLINSSSHHTAGHSSIPPTELHTETHKHTGVVRYHPATVTVKCCKRTFTHSQVITTFRTLSHMLLLKLLKPVSPITLSLITSMSGRNVGWPCRMLPPGESQRVC